MTDTTIILQNQAEITVVAKMLDGIPGQYPVIEVRAGADRFCIIGMHDEPGRQLLCDLRDACDKVLTGVA